MRLVRDSSGTPSWTITFCIVVLVMTCPLIVVEILWKPGLIPLVEKMWLMTLGAFISRELAVKAPKILETLNGNGGN